MYDVIVIGAGPAGMAAGLCATHNKLKTLVIAKAPGSLESGKHSSLIDPKVLQERFLEAAKKNTGHFEFQNHQTVTAIDKNIVSFSVETISGQLLYARAVIVCTGTTGEEGNSQFDTLSAKDARGKVKVNANMQTNVPGVFAAGSITSITVGNTLEAALYQGGIAAVGALYFLKEAGGKRLDNLA